MTSSRSARRARRDERRRRAALSTEPRTEPITGLRTAAYDATTIEFSGASDAGLADHDVYRYEPHPEPAPRTEPVARLRARPPQQPPPAGYAATTGPMPAIGRPAVSIGDALTHDETWGPKLAPVPCGHCGTPPPVPDGILERTRIIGHVNWLAARDGWKYDVDLILTCPPCQQGEAWKARQGQLEVRWPDGGYCDRHDFPDCELTAARCRCPGPVLATDVMLTSHDYLKTGRAISIQYIEDAKAGPR